MYIRFYTIDWIVFGLWTLYISQFNSKMIKSIMTKAQLIFIIKMSYFNSYLGP